MSQSINLSDDELKATMLDRMNRLSAPLHIFTPEECVDIVLVDYVEWSEEERNILEDILRKKKKVLDVRGYAKRFKKEIKKTGFIVSDNRFQCYILVPA